MSNPIAIVMSEVFLRRLTPALSNFTGRTQDYRILSIHRSIEELKPILEEIQPSGLITEWLPQKTDELLGLKLKIPHIIVATHKLYPNVFSVDVDDLAVGREAANALAQVGFRSFACLGNGTPYSELRVQGFMETISSQDIPFSYHTESGFEELRYSESFTEPSQDMIAWLKALPKPCGIFAVHDPLGRFLSGACSELGIRVPDEVAIIGANNDPLVCGLTYPMLSSISIPWDEVGMVVGASMQTMIRGEGTLFNTCQLISPSGVMLRHSANHLAIQDDMLRRAMSYMTERLQEAISIGTLCSHLKISRRTLERKFKDVVSCTPWEMLCQIRVNQAKRLLAETLHSISHIAELSGFHDPERMAVVFKRVTGKSPSQFRRRLAMLPSKK